MSETKKVKVLIMEDDSAMREIVSHKLISEGFDVKTAENGEIGVQTAEVEKPDIILLDLMMPELDGFGVLKRIRENTDPTISQVPVIVLSNLWSSEDILRVKSFKVEDYMVKAYFTPNEILGKIVEVLDRIKLGKSVIRGTNSQVG